MKRRCTQKNVLLQVIRVEDGKFCCRAEDNCSYKQETLMPGNFKRHIYKLHPVVYAPMDLPEPTVEKSDEPAKKRQKKLCVDTSPEQVQLGILQLSTVDGLPYSFPEMVGFRTLVGPLCKAAGITANRKTVSDLVDNSAHAARQIISNELNHQPLIAIEVDGASRGARHFVGINARFIDDGKVVVRNLAIKETRELSKLYSVTHDNGANMVASVRELKKSLKSSDIELSSLVDICFDDAAEEQYDTSDDEDEHCDEQMVEACNAELDIEEDENDDFANGKDGENDKTVEASPDTEYCEILGSVRCAAHTAQLAVWDVAKPYEKRVAKIQKLVIKLRQREYYKFIKEHDAHLPPYSNKTRWNSTYLMLKSLLKQKAFFNMLRKAYPEIDFTQHWKFIEKFCEAFEAPFILTLQLQKRHVCLSDFYAYWLVCQAKLMRLTENCLAKRLMESFQRRLEKLTESLHFKACVLLDPRFNFLGSKRISSKDKDLAQEFLAKLHSRLSGIIDEGVNNHGNDIEEDDLEIILAEFFDEHSDGNSSLTSKSNTTFAQKLKALEMREKVPILGTPRPGPSKSSENYDSFDLLKYWEGQKFSNPELYIVAMIVLSASATQVSVERSFSALKLTLNDQRMNLTSQAVENALLLRLNADLLPKVVTMIGGEEL